MNTDPSDQECVRGGALSRHIEHEAAQKAKRAAELTPEHVDALRAERDEALLLMEKHEDAARAAPGFWGGFAARASIARREAEAERDKLEQRVQEVQVNADAFQKERDALAERLARIELAWDNCGGLPTAQAEYARLHELIVEATPHVDETLARLRREVDETHRRVTEARANVTRTAPRDEVIPELPPHQLFICSEGCGICEPELFDFVYSETRDSMGHVFEQMSHKAVRSPCCQSEVEIWDDEKNDTIPWPEPEAQA